MLLLLVGRSDKHCSVHTSRPTSDFISDFIQSRSAITCITNNITEFLPNFSCKIITPTGSDLPKPVKVDFDLLLTFVNLVATFSCTQSHVGSGYAILLILTREAFDLLGKKLDRCASGNQSPYVYVMEHRSMVGVTPP